MINTHVKFEAKIPYGSKIVAYTLQNIFKSQGQFDLEGQVHQFSNTSEIFRSMNSLSVKAKFQMGQLKI